MKIAMIGHKRIPSREGGIEIVVEELSKRMVRRGHTVHAYNRSGKHVADKSKSLRKLKRFQGIRIITIPTINVKSLDAMLYSFFATIRALFGGYDVIHYHAEGPCVMILLAHIFGKKTVATIHGLDWQRAKWGGFATKYLKFGEKMAAKYADQVIVLSKNVQQYFYDTYHRRVSYVPNGVNEPEIFPADKINDKYGLEKDNYFLFLARIVPEKGLHYLLEAFKEIKSDKKLVIAGGSSHSSEYVDQIKELAAKDERVLMTGFVQGRELEELFSNCYAYVLPSDVEGMPISLLEALSYGCQCIVSDIPENIEVVGDLAYQFKKSDVNSLREVLEKALKDGYLYDSETIIHECLRRFNWNTVVARHMNLYEKDKRTRKERKQEK